MQRHEMMTAMTELGLKGMAGAFDEAVTTGLQRKRTTMEVLTDLLRAEATHRHAASVRYRMSAARLPAVKDLDAFVGTVRNFVREAIGWNGRDHRYGNQQGRFGPASGWS